MRFKITPLFVFAFYFGMAQIANNGFRNWTYGIDSFGFSTYIPEDTFSYLKLDNWTSSNSITGNPDAGHQDLVNQYMDAGLGKDVVRMNTANLNITGTLNEHIVVPGFVVNGNFVFDLQTIVFQQGGIIDPAKLAGAGSPISQRYESIAAHIKYMPVPNDSLLFWAVLKSHGNKVAESKVFLAQSTNSYLFITGRFNYISCDIPDTVVVLVASSTPSFATLYTGNSGLNPGSVLLLDSVALIAGTTSPVANAYSVSTFQNQPVSINVVAGDTDCQALSLTAAIVSQPANGSATLNGSSTIVYTPANNYTGYDTMYYSVNNGQNSSSAPVYINVLSGSGINDVQPVYYSLYPNPAGDYIKISSGTSIEGTLQIVDLMGQTVMETKINSTLLNVNTTTLSPGVYLAKINTPAGYQVLRFAKE